jgi:IS5 family transposase
MAAPPLTAEQGEKNRIKSRVRAKVEHVFGQWVMCLGGQCMRYVFWERQSLANNL